ncbi:MAG: alpha/beta hydrolase [Alphaproteobacteria bacterium]|nr:MAG: alpha/beta hydrolase [Alphaproteobacteria bacterium]
MNVSYFSENRALRLAYVRTASSEGGHSLPAVLFLGGFKSDMMGTKAIYLEAQCTARGQEFVRFDYTGHGLSDGVFVDGIIGSWKQDAKDILDHVVMAREVILVGSSMGGWIALRLLIEHSARIAGVVGIAAAPDFTKDIESRMGQAERAMVDKIGRLEVANDYSDEPYIFTKELLEDGRMQSVLHENYSISCPLTLIQGKLDADVPWEKALKIQKCFQGPAAHIEFVEDGDHRLSRDQDLALINTHIMKLSGMV